MDHCPQEASSPRARGGYWRMPTTSPPHQMPVQTHGHALGLLPLRTQSTPPATPSPQVPPPPATPPPHQMPAYKFCHRHGAQVLGELDHCAHGVEMVREVAGISDADPGASSQRARGGCRPRNPGLLPLRTHSTSPTTPPPQLPLPPGTPPRHQMPEQTDHHRRAGHSRSPLFVQVLLRSQNPLLLVNPFRQIL